MNHIALTCVRALIALLAIVPTPALLAQSALSAPSGQTAAVDAQRFVDQWTEEWDPVTQQWTRVDTASPAPGRANWARERVGGSGQGYGALARFGPFVVVNETTANLIGTTDSHTPADFSRMLAVFPHLRTLNFVDAPGTINDLANLELGRMIRASALATHIPRGGSARSGAVELFLAGSHRTMEPGALFAVHSWLDNHGREPKDFPEDHPANRIYIDYYIAMGMSESAARGFYAMTNSVPHSRALWFGPDQMRRWIGAGEDSAAPIEPPPPITIAYRFDWLLDGLVVYGG